MKLSSRAEALNTGAFLELNYGAEVTLVCAFAACRRQLPAARGYVCAALGRCPLPAGGLVCRCLELSPDKGFAAVQVAAG